MTNKLHEYDKDALQGELNILSEVKDLLLSTQVSGAVYEALEAEANAIRLELQTYASKKE